MANHMDGSGASAGSGVDPGLASILQQVLGSPSNPQTPNQLGAPQQSGGTFTLSDLEALLTGTSMAVSGRSGETTQKFVGPMPTWVPKQVRSFVQGGVLDPYLGLDKSPAEYRVYVATKPGRTVTRPHISLHDGEDPHIGPNETKKIPAKDKSVTVQQAMNEPYLWSEDEVAANIKKFQDAGVRGVTDFDTLTKAWGGLVQRAGSMYSLSSGKRKVTPWDVLSIYKDEQVKAGTFQPLGPGDPGFNGSVTHVQRSVSDIDQGDAWTAMQSTLSHMLGRDPSDQEVRDFTYRMNSLASRNPSITKTIENYKNGQVSNTSSHTKQGFGSNDIAEAAYKGAQADPDYAEFQSATTYFNAAASALGALGG